MMTEQPASPLFEGDQLKKEKEDNKAAAEKAFGNIYKFLALLTLAYEAHKNVIVDLAQLHALELHREIKASKGLTPKAMGNKYREGIKRHKILHEELSKKIKKVIDQIQLGPDSHDQFVEMMNHLDAALEKCTFKFPENEVSENPS